MSETRICKARHINHICIAVKDINETLMLYRRLFALGEAEVEEIGDQGVKAALIRVGGSQIEFIQPTDPDGSVARFLERRGEGVHHICFEVDDLKSTLEDLAKAEVPLVDRVPREGLSGMIAFIHPKATGGVLVELVDEGSAKR